MDVFDLATYITELALALTKCLCHLFCARDYEDIEATIEAIRNPQSFYGDAKKLQDLLNEIRPMSPREETDKWIEETDKTIRQVNQLVLLKGGSSSNHNDDLQSSCLCLSCGGDADACFRCNLHRKIKKLIARGEIIKLPTLGRKPVVPIGGIPVIGDDSTAGRNLKRVMDMFNDDDVWCIGVWGPGGVGKTTLAKALNNKLAKGKPSFSLVRLIELKANDRDSEMQEAIAKSLGLNMGEGIADRIRSTLQREKFLLILDNLWKSIDFPTIGIPERWKGSKIILTTRSRRVCTKMDAKAIEVEYLKEEEAWQLFAEKVGRGVTNNKVIEPLAKEVCKECGYLPLALVVVGSAMKGETNTVVWRNAITSLQSSVPINVDIESKLYNPLKLSYNALDDTLKSCFLYCSLYPEGYHIELNELVECWVAENLIDKGLYYTDACNKGLGLINKLKQSCLVEEAGMLSEQNIKLHDVVRDVARWIGKSDKRSDVLSGYGLSLSPIVELPEDVKSFRWISFVDNREIELPKCKKDYSSVTTLLIRGARSEDLGPKTKREKKHLMVSTQFLNGFPAVKVLNLEGVESFDAPLLKLEELHALILRDCSDIKAVPTANNLKILDLSTSSVLANILGGMKAFSNLKVLNLCHTNGLKRIDGDTIQSLNLLEVLDMDRSDYRWPVRKRSGSGEATLEDLSRLQWLREVYLELAETDGTYEDCIWMARLECFYFSYHHHTFWLEKNHLHSLECNSISIRQFKRKIFDISMNSGDTGVGSFLLHAEHVWFWSQNVIAKEIFANFSSTDQSNSKLKKLSIGERFSDGLMTISSESTIPKDNVRKHVTRVSISGSGLLGGVFFNVEELLIRKWFGGFSNLAHALGANFDKLKGLELSMAVYVFSSDDLNIVLPELERISLNWCDREAIFDYGPTQIQAIAPKLKILEVKDSHRLEILCKCESNEQWPYLEILQVRRCPRLKKLPFMPSIKEIRGSIEWWNQVEWDSEKEKSHMNQRFKPL